MTDTGGWDDIAAAWERVFTEVAQLGGEIADVYRRAYEEQRGDEGDEEAGAVEEAGLAEERVAPTAEADEAEGHGPAVGEALSDVSGTIERSLRAARATFGEVADRMKESERTQELAREVELAVKVSLHELGTALTRLSEAFGEDLDVRDDGTAETGGPDDDEGGGAEVIDLRDGPKR